MHAPKQFATALLQHAFKPCQPSEQRLALLDLITVTQVSGQVPHHLTVERVALQCLPQAGTDGARGVAGLCQQQLFLAQ
ncbi:hypothetical protein D3C81_1087440 [compost metagenome]